MGTRGGSRWGAGRPGWRQKAENCRSVDVRRFAAENMLRPGLWSWSWRDAETKEVVASITVMGGEEHMALSYRVGEESFRAEVPIMKTACNYGGDRPWFSCPHCRRRVAKLYLKAKHFACRHCHRLNYASQAADPCGRTWRKQNRLQARLDPNWQRPKHMHLATYNRLIEAILACEQERDALIAEALGRLMLGLDALRVRFPNL